jgi:hypothetical protein
MPGFPPQQDLMKDSASSPGLATDFVPPGNYRSRDAPRLAPRSRWLNFQKVDQEP